MRSRTVGTIFGSITVWAGLLSAPRTAQGMQYYLAQDLGVHGASHLCAYSDGQVHAFSALQLCPLTINGDRGQPTIPPATAGETPSDGDLSLFDSGGDAVAYIDMDDDMTIYLWGGKPVAYLDGDGSGQYNVYGFNGQHLGWFSDGAVWDHAGYAACAVQKRLMTVPQIASIKGIQQIAPIRAIEQIAPIEPILMNAFGKSSCESLLASGVE